MSNPYAVFETLNLTEGFIWFGIAVALPFFVKSSVRRQRTSLLAASCGFVLFGFSDFLEAPTQGDVPPWLWIWKISNAAFLLGCRVSYLGWRDFRFTDRWLVFGSLCLIASVAIICLS